MKYFIATYGCQANKADYERIARRLENMGHQKVKADSSAEALAKADLIVLNACSVRQSAMDRIYSKIHQLQRRTVLRKTEDCPQKIILTGCVLPQDRKKLKNKVSEIWHPDEYFDLAPIYSNSSSACVPIMTGCNNFCAYCAVPYTRGREKSRPAKEIIEEIKNLIKKNYKEIWLLGQNVNSYSSPSVKFPALLKMINDLPGNFQIKFLTSHPKDMSEELIKTIANSERVVKEIHLPVQSGDNQILKKMNRHYTVGQYKNLVKKIKKMIPDVKISTDVIVGFPEETKKQFQNTVKLFKEIKFDKAYIACYSPRPGTAAAKLKDSIPRQEKKRRWRILDTLINKFKH